jgi:serine/threonine protein kinase
MPAGAAPAARASLARRFRAELQTLSAYRHPRIVRLLHSAVEAGVDGAPAAGGARPVALVLELLEDGSLADWLRGPAGEAARRSNADGSPLSAAQRIDIALGVASGLSYLHGLREEGEGGGDAPTQPVVHRDVKSANVGLTRPPHNGGQLYAKLLDCGLAKALHGEGASAAPGAATVRAGGASISRIFGPLMEAAARPAAAWPFWAASCTRSARRSFSS